MLTKTSLIVFIIFLDQFWYIVMSDSEKIKIFIFWKKEEDLHLFLVAKSEKTYKKILFAPTGTCKKWVSE